MLPKEYSRIVQHDMLSVFFQEKETIGFTLLPAEMEHEIPEHRKTMNGSRAAANFTRTLNLNLPAVHIEPLAQIKLAGDMPGSTANYAGASRKYSTTMEHVRFDSQKISEDQVETCFSDEKGRFSFRHVLKRFHDRPYFEAFTEFTNRSGEVLCLDLLESFSLGMLSLFQKDAGNDTYRIHRFLGGWSAEGRMVSCFAEELGLEQAWAPFYGRSVRYRHCGSRPVHENFPCLVLEDTEKGVCWAVQIAALGPWQIEISRISDFLNLSGGSPDCDSGWQRSVAPGETIRSISSLLTCFKGDVEQTLQRLHAWTEDHAAQHPEAEKDFPVSYNDFCTCWGRAAEEAGLKTAKALEGSGVRYFTLDAGWFVKDGTELGNWVVNNSLYPDGGLRSFLEKIRRKGFIPGIWFEFEVASPLSCPGQHPEEFLICLNGKPYEILPRRFLDFRKKEAREWIDRKMISLLREYHIGYLKVDYNADLIGVDSPGQSAVGGLEDALDAIREYYEHIRKELPDVTIEICASGGHRLTPAWMRLGDMASFSDAHESVAIPLIAANTLRMIPARWNQVWAVLRKEDSEDREFYTLTAGMLGRLCLSGDIAELSPGQRGILDNALEFYQQTKRTICCGTHEIRRRLFNLSQNAPKGFQQVIFRSGGSEVILIHTFEDSPETIEIPTENVVKHSFLPANTLLKQLPGKLILSGIREFSGYALQLE